MSEQMQKRGVTERLIGLSKTIDKLTIVGGAVVGLAFNPALGGLMIGSSIVTMEAGNQIEAGIRKRRARKLGAAATAHVR